MTVLRSLCLLLVVASPVHAQRDAVSTLVDRYVAWRGGAAYRDVASIYEAGRVGAAGLTGTFERFAGRDGREYTHTRLGTSESATGVSPAGNWTENQGVVQEMDSGSAVDTRRSIALELGDALLGRGGASVTRVADESRDGTSWAVLRVTFGGPDRYDVFLDGATGALHGWRITEDRVTHFRRFGEWRIVSGVRMPFLTEDLYDNRAENSVQRDDSIALGVPLPDSLFARPASVKMAQFGGGRTETDPVPFTFFRQRQIYIAAKVNGHPVDLLLDSGAGRTVIDKTYADSIGLTTEGKGVANGTGGQLGTSFARDVLVTVGTMTLRVPTAVVIDLSGVEKLVGRPMHVILGADVFKEVVVDIDFAKHAIALHDPDTFHAPAGADTVPITPGASSRTVPVRIENGPPVQVDFDIGNGGALMVFSSYWQPHDMTRTHTVSSTMSGGVGGVHETKVLSVKQLTFAGHTFTDVPTDLSPAGIQAVDGDRSFGNLGILVYARFRMMTDYPHDRLYLVPNAIGFDAPFERDRSGLSVLEEGHTLRVLNVAPGSPARASGWKVGDVITAVNGQAIGDHYETSPLAGWNEGAAGTTVTLTLANGTKRELTLRTYY
jgi:hypothetical protein